MFIDAIMVKVRDDQVGNRPVYAAMGVDLDGNKDILGVWTHQRWRVVVSGPRDPHLYACAGGTLGFRLQSFRIEVPCDNSCDNSWPNGGIHGHSWSVSASAVDYWKTQSRRSEAPDLRLRWWPGAGSNRRPSDFQSEFGFAPSSWTDTAKPRSW